VGRVGDEFKFHLVNWSKISTQLSSGGLEVSRRIFFYQSLLGNWLWRYDTEREVLWRAVVEAKYESLWGGWCWVLQGGGMEKR
jgi:hypothetical protein